MNLFLKGGAFHELDWVDYCFGLLRDLNVKHGMLTYHHISLHKAEIPPQVLAMGGRVCHYSVINDQQNHEGYGEDNYPNFCQAVS